MDFFKTLQKGALGFLTGLGATVVFGVVQALTNYKPVICSDTIVTDCTPQMVSTAYYAIIPVVAGFLVGIGNWLKNRQKV